MELRARPSDFAVLSLALTAVLALCAGTLCTRRGLRLAVPAAWGFVLLGQSAVHNIVPAWFCGASLATVALALTAGAWVRPEGFKGTNVYTLTPLADGSTRLDEDGRYWFDNGFARFMTPVICWQAKKKMLSDLEQLRARLEGGI